MTFLAHLLTHIIAPYLAPPCKDAYIKDHPLTMKIEGKGKDEERRIA